MIFNVFEFLFLTHHVWITTILNMNQNSFEFSTMRDFASARRIWTISCMNQCEHMIFNVFKFLFSWNWRHDLFYTILIFRFYSIKEIMSPVPAEKKFKYIK